MPARKPKPDWVSIILGAIIAVVGLGSFLFILAVTVAALTPGG